MTAQVEWGRRNKEQVWNLAVRLPNTPRRDVLHNHGTVPHIVYAGMGERGLPPYHLWRCTATNNPPRNLATFQVYDQDAFDPGSNEYEGGCSTPRCPGDAEFMYTAPIHIPGSSGIRRTACGDCAARARGVVPCPWTLTLTCRRELVGEDCATCEIEEGHDK